MNHKKWFDVYSRWQNSCIFELLDMGHDVAYNGHDVDINEDGSVSFDNLSFTAPGYVTSWKESKYYRQ